ncbi:MAG: hypothetical protein A3H35_02925 [Betaproteobacteria bacterium RIFCSPLOWO2_02_FULL_62_17]|nr:MAG: hypothetical protein A3H35_02925 [Betaproteobacteria bacterium RIFCSPLOWO2_02_FULL_62_17]
MDFASFVGVVFDFTGFFNDLARAAALGTFFLLGLATAVAFLPVGLAFASFAGVVFDFAGFSKGWEFDFRIGAFCTFLIAFFAAFLACFAAFFSAFLAFFSARFACFAAFFSAFLAFFSANSFAFVFLTISASVESLENDVNNKSAHEFVAAHVVKDITPGNRNPVWADTGRWS